MTEHFVKAAAVIVLTVACGAGPGPEEGPTPWRPVHSPTTKDINALWVIAEDDIWACGAGGNILQYDGYEWRLDITAPAPDFFDVEFVSPAQGWVCGKDGWVGRRDGGEWSRVPGNVRTNDLYALHAHGAAEAWFCGSRGVVLHYLNGEWKDESPGIDEDLHGIWVVGRDRGWLAGDNGRILRRSNGTWVPVTGPVEAHYRCAFFVADDEGWFGATDGYVVHLKGGGLSKTHLPSPETVTGLYFKRDGPGYAVTRGGNIYTYSPKGGWQSWGGHDRPLFDVSFAGEDEGWAVGAAGTILRH